jgi:hypothetical protein
VCHIRKTEKKKKPKKIGVISGDLRILSRKLKYSDIMHGERGIAKI